MDWQQVASLGIVAVTAVLLVRGQLRARKYGAHTCADCALLKISREKSIIRVEREIDAPASRRGNFAAHL